MQYADTFFHELQYLAGKATCDVDEPAREPGYGEAFTKAIVRIGRPGLRDLMAAVDFLLARGHVDRTALGHRGSYGGFMTIGSWDGPTGSGRGHPAKRGQLYSFYGSSDFGYDFENGFFVGPGGTRRPLSGICACPRSLRPERRTPLLILHSTEDHRCPISRPRSSSRPQGAEAGGGVRAFRGREPRTLPGPAAEPPGAPAPDRRLVRPVLGSRRRNPRPGRRWARRWGAGGGHDRDTGIIRAVLLVKERAGRGEAAPRPTSGRPTGALSSTISVPWAPHRDGPAQILCAEKFASAGRGQGGRHRREGMEAYPGGASGSSIRSSTTRR